MVDSQKFNSLRVRLQHAGPLEINEVLGEILNFPEQLNSVVPILISKIKAGQYVLDDHLVSLLLQTSALGLYEQIQDQVLKNRWAVLNLYKGRYSDNKIEELLCKWLYEIASDDGNSLRRFIVDAMQEVGSVQVLPTLEALVFELMPSAKIRTIFSESLGGLGCLEATSRISFLQRVELAIDEIKRRNSAVSEEIVPECVVIEPIQTLGYDDSFDSSSAKFEDDFDASSPIICVMLIRRNAEALAKNSYQRLGYEKNGKPAKKMMLDELIKPLRDGGAPDILIHLLQTLQLFGNFAAHDQGKQSSHLTKEIASALKILYEQAIKSHSAWHSTGDQGASTSSQ